VEVPAAGSNLIFVLRDDLVAWGCILLYEQSDRVDWGCGALLVLRIKVVVLGFLSHQDSGLLDACPH
jgi:hypothetical protein